MQLLESSPRNEAGPRPAAWRRRWQVEPQIAAVGLLCYWAYLDLTSASPPRPAGLQPVLVRLYNLMHFGHSAAMSIEAVIVMFLPVALWAAMMAAARAVRG